MTGRTPLPPPWALGFHQSRWEAPCEGAPAERPFCSGAQMVQLAQSFRDRGIPADGLFLDIQHMNGFRSFTFDGARFPDPKGMLARLRALGFETSTIVDPGIKVDAAWDVYQAGQTNGHFLNFEGDVWAGKAAFPDFTAKKTRAWWSDLTSKLATRGVRGALPIFAREGAIIPRTDVGSNVAASRGGTLYLDFPPGCRGRREEHLHDARGRRLDEPDPLANHLLARADRDGGAFRGQRSRRGLRRSSRPHPCARPPRRSRPVVREARRRCPGARCIGRVTAAGQLRVGRK